MLKLVGFTGIKRSGKDTCGGLLSANHNFKKVHFAYPLKKFAADLTGLPFEIFDHPRLKEQEFEFPVKLDEEYVDMMCEKLDLTNLKQVADISSKAVGYEFTTWRQFLQFVGTDLVRDCVDKDYWTNKGIEAIQNHLDLGHNVAVCDVRFPNEVKAVQDLGGKVFRVNRKTGNEVDNHASEAQDYEVDGDIENNGDFDSLKKQIFEKVGV